MFLYHYTSRGHFHWIDREGLTRGRVWITSDRSISGNWLTTDFDPSGHGIDDLNRQVRITVRIPRSHPNLSHWPEWGSKNISDEWYSKLNIAGDFKHNTWFIFWEDIPRDLFWHAEAIDGGFPLRPRWPTLKQIADRDKSDIG